MEYITRTQIELNYPNPMIIHQSNLAHGVFSVRASAH